MKTWEITSLLQEFISGEIPENMLPTPAQVGASIHAQQTLFEAGELALFELDRIGSDIGFEPERYRERIRALDALSRAIRDTEIAPERLDDKEVIIDN
jgi:hypothetical protein